MTVIEKKQPITVVDIARTQLGVEESGGANRGLPYVRYAIKGEQPLAWCARFCRWCFNKAGTPLPGNKWEIASVTALQNALALAGGWLDTDVIPQPGDLILLNEYGTSDVGRVGHHVGIVESIAGDLVTSIDGNWSNKVCRVRRHLRSKEVWGFGRWPAPPSA